jgi:hypothetical protein
MTCDLRISGICERDLDLLFAEELVASEAFRSMLLDAADIANSKGHTILAVRRGATHSTGESDLELDISYPGGDRATLLIENKVDAALQHRQAERYCERANAHVAAGRCSVARTLVVAPSRYFSQDDDSGFDASLTYEEVLNWLRSSSLDANRREYKQALLGAAIEKAALGYQRVADESMVALWQRYEQIAAELAPGLEVPPSDGRPSGSHFVYFRADAIPKPMQLVHKFVYGHVDVQFPRWGVAVGRLRQELAAIAPKECLIVKAAKSAVLRRIVPPVRVGYAAEARDDNIRIGILAANELAAWARANAALLEALAKGPA